ncbi:hypothetical protein KFE96_09640 [Kordiimonas sp. SCSIO 12603]|uniref:hypothetical protein n=1 Tax=Kordiimonas sp. SCSIO 12603 TaxID=2829596 RepID=UPI0021059C3F|nr:hypothetical protein [Kordiimonas sp. SCSIO 12603]UTW57128.1 hypothetical protein KFE96_09640 [Kordiimonas sp. SCSIO 12603]
MTPKPTERTLPHILIETSSIIEQSTASNFADIINNKGLSLEKKRREHAEMFATTEWFIPTAIVLYITKPYFESFLKEMGKDHYQLLKKGLKYLFSEAYKYKIKKIASSGSKKKISSDKQYSLGLSLFFQTHNLGVIKFLFEEEMNTDDAQKAIDRITAFIIALNEGSIEESFVSKMIERRSFGETILMSYEAAADEFVVLDVRRMVTAEDYPRISGTSISK